MKKCVIGLDIGTTCTKVILVDEAGKILSQGSSGYPLHSRGEIIEQDPEDWVKAACRGIREAMAAYPDAEVAAISLSTQGGSTVVLDKNGAPVGYAWTWMDKRSIPEAKLAEEVLGAEYIYHTTGWASDPCLDAAKIHRMKTLPEYKNAAGFVTTLEYMNLFLTGRNIIDPSNAAMRQLYNVEKGIWEPKLLEFAGVTEKELPEILPTGALVGGLSDHAARATGLLPGTPVYNGAHDQYCASLGSGAVKEGDMLLSAGTTWVLMGIGKTPLFSKSRIAPGKHPVEGLYGNIASLICSGASLQWFKNNFLPDEFDEMNRQVALRRDKTDDLCFFPYMAGAEYPIWNLKARGAFTGITLEHDRFDFARAIMEGVSFGIRMAVEDFAANGTEIKEITMMGGASKSPVWMDILASVARVPILGLNVSDVCGLGAAAIAGCGAGFFDSYEEAARRMVSIAATHIPNPEDTARYETKYRNYCRMWDKMSRYYAE